jgi:hypothetical protein
MLNGPADTSAEAVHDRLICVVLTVLADRFVGTPGGAVSGA